MAINLSNLSLLLTLSKLCGFCSTLSGMRALLAFDLVKKSFDAAASLLRARPKIPRSLQNLEELIPCKANINTLYKFLHQLLRPSRKRSGRRRVRRRRTAWWWRLATTAEEKRPDPVTTMNEITVTDGQKNSVSFLRSSLYLAVKATDGGDETTNGEGRVAKALASSSLRIGE